MNRTLSRIIILICLGIASFCIGISWPDLKLGFSSQKLSTPFPFRSQENNEIDRVTKIFSESYNRIIHQFYKPVNRDKLKYSALIGLFAATGDPNTSYFPPKAAKEFMEETRGNISGIGALLGPDPLGARVSKVYPDTPAAEVGIKAEDLVVAVDGKSINGVAINNIVTKIRGKEGTPVKLRIIRDKSPKPLEVLVTRRTVVIPTITSKYFKDTNIGYIRISSFTGFTGEQFDKALDEIKRRNPKGIVIDLRGNGGGFLETATEMLSRFVSGKLVVTIKPRDGKPEQVMTQVGRVCKPHCPFVILMNGESASASEIFSGVLKDYGIATLVGTHSYGKSSVQVPYPLLDGAMAKITVARYYLPKGEDINRKVDEDGQYLRGGLKPDVEVTADSSESPIEPDEPAKDPQLKKAIEVLLEQAAKFSKK